MSRDSDKLGNSKVSRRDFLAGALGTAAFTVVPSHVLGGDGAPSNTLNLALIGTRGRARAHYGWMDDENVVALCDVDGINLGRAEKKFSKAEKYTDWRKCLDQKNLDGVVICTPDHQHAFISTWAMNRDLHVYGEKPLGHSVEECRVVREKYLEKKHKIATQNGTQRHAIDNFNRVHELVRDGAIGELDDVHVWGRRQIPRPGYPAKKGSPPDYLDFDKWVGPSPYHPYNPSYFAGYKIPQDHKGNPGGSNCLNWNMYWDFGSGQVGDMGSHTMDLVWGAIEGSRPISAQAEGEKFNPDVTPVKMKATFELPANDWRPGITVTWWQGQMMPPSPRSHVDLTRIGHGAMLKGSKGFIICSFRQRLIIPHGSNADMTYYDAPESEDDLMDPLGNFAKEWTNACKTDLKTTCDFDYSGTMTELMELGLVAYQVDGKIKYDPDRGRVTNNAKADGLVSRKNLYRDGWVLDG